MPLESVRNKRDPVNRRTLNSTIPENGIVALQ